MKMFKSLFVLGLTVVSMSAASLVWNRNPEPDVAYRVYTIENSVTNMVDVGTAITYAIPSKVGSSRSWFLTAYSTNSLLESLPSETVSWTEFPAIPAINVTSYNIEDFRAGQWQNVTVTWNGLSNTQYGFTNYNLIAVAGTVTNTYTTLNTSYTIPTLPRATWSFYIYVKNDTSTSPLGTALVLNGTSPQAPRNVTVNK